LVLAGRIPPPQQKKDYFFFKKHIEKELNQGNIKYVGEINEEKLKNVYKNAIAFLYPLQWEEPFGLTVIESMACGTPVIAFKRGSMEEIINDKKTGFVIPAERKKKVNYEGFIKAMEKIGQISRKDCRKWVEERFDKQRMVIEYEKLYYRILEKQ
jgi:glycosyltransferase involved in cell wall biosynthesis